ncbi:MAG: ATP-binding cassette domain-containing protein [bacterium]
MIEINDATIQRDGIKILEDITLKVADGQIVTVIGESGCGKSTLLRAVMRLIPIAAGEICIDGVCINGLSEHQMNEVRKKMGMVFQEGALFDSMNVRENVAFALRQHTRMKESEIRQTVSERLEAVGLADAEKKMPSQLSGGMRRRVAIARALALHPKILLYDEPTTGLDPVLTDTILDLIVRMRNRYNTTTIVVTHDMDAAIKISDRIALIHDKHIAADDVVESIKNNPNPLLKRFLHGQGT